MSWHPQDILLVLTDTTQDLWEIHVPVIQQVKGYLAHLTILVQQNPAPRLHVNRNYMSKYWCCNP